MTDVTSRKSTRRPHHWRRDLIELAALFTAVAVADAIANVVAHGPDGPVLLVASAVALAATATFHVWWARRHTHAPPESHTGGESTGDTGTGSSEPAQAAPSGPSAESATGTGTATTTCTDTAPATAATSTAVARSDAADSGSGGTTLWRLRTTVRDAPGSLAALCGALARQEVDILTLQTHPLSHGTVDEFLLRAPDALPSAALARAVGAAGGRDTWTERADTHDLVDTPAHVLHLATRTALDAAELPLALRQLLGRCTIHSLPARSLGGQPLAEPVPGDGVLEDTEIRLPDPSGGAITISRPYLPFTPTEFARARALVALDARLGPRVPHGRDVLTLPEGNEITVRRAGTDDLDAALAMHRRCSAGTLSRRYHGPVKDADRYLGHLLSPRFGRTLAAQTASGRLVALGHLLWDGDETEVALLVEDAWQRRGIGAQLLRRLVALATEAGSGSVYAVTQASNTGMAAAMRGLGLPLDYQIEEGTLVITARLSAAPVTAPGPHGPREAYGRP